MSHWTHIIASIDVDTYHNDKDIKGYVENILANAPKITGSEGPADVFVNVKSGWNHSTWDEEANERERYQTRVVITVLGDLRDRERWRTRDEWYAFRDYVKARVGYGYDFRNCVCRIHD